MAISRTTLRANVYSTIRTILVNANLLSGAVKVTGSYTAEDANLPEVCISNPTVSKSEFSFNRSNYNDEIVVMIDIYTKKAIQIDQIVDEIDTLGLKNIDGLQFQNWEESIDFDNPNENKLHIKTITLTYLLR